MLKVLLIAGALWLGMRLVGGLTTVVLRCTNPLRKRCRSGKTLCLTFDDGMDPRYTPKLLDLLAEQEIHASFFLLASTAAQHPELLRRIQKEGHTIGLHSLNHQNQILQLPHSLWMDFRKSMQILTDLEAKPAYYRPPWGHATLLGLWLCRRYRLKQVLWTVIVGDWAKDASVDGLCRKLRSQVHGTAVICLHDGRGTGEAPLKTIGALERMIPYWKEEGYVFETISEFLEEHTD